MKDQAVVLSHWPSVAYLIWSLPILIIVGAIASGRASAVGAGVVGLMSALAVACTMAPAPLGPQGVADAGTRGLWLGWLVATVMLGGLFFRESIAFLTPERPLAECAADSFVQRRRMFSICFLMGPFAEGATGFGVGQVATIAALSSLALAPVNIIVFGLFSQILVPWGAMANGTIVGAQLSGLTALELGTVSALLSVPLLLAWLGIFWRMTSAAGFRDTPLMRAQEVLWVLAALGALTTANWFLGPEIAALAALGPLLVVRFWLEERPDGTQWKAAFCMGLPYGVLILGFAASRSVPALREFLAGGLVLQPFADGLSWAPWLHPGTWLAGVGAMTAILAGRSADLPRAAGRAWAGGWRPVLTVMIYLTIAEIMAHAGMARGVAEGLRQSLGTAAIVLVPVMSGGLGFLTGSSNAANGLLMPSQIGLVEGYVSTLAIAGLQNVAAAAMTMLSPVRVAMGCALLGQLSLQRRVYAEAWPLGAGAIGILTLIAVLVMFLG